MAEKGILAVLFIMFIITMGLGCLGQTGEEGIKGTVLKVTTTTMDVDPKATYITKNTIPNQNMVEKDPRCFLRYPAARGDCETMLGAYYDLEANICYNIRGCEAIGHLPFDSSEGDALRECLDTCVDLRRESVA